MRRNRGDTTVTILVVLGVVVALAVLVMAVVMIEPKEEEVVIPIAALHTPPAPAPAPVAVPSDSSPEAAPQPPALVGEPYITPAGRSPIPQEGEDLRKPLPYVKLVDDSTPPPAAGTIVPWDQAAQYVGHTITIEGKIIRAHNTGGICFLNFVPEHPSDAFYMVVFPPLFEAWGEPPEKFFLEKTVRVTGEIELHRGKPQLKINKQEQVEILD